MKNEILSVWTDPQIQHCPVTSCVDCTKQERSLTIDKSDDFTRARNSRLLVKRVDDSTGAPAMREKLHSREKEKA